MAILYPRIDNIFINKESPFTNISINTINDISTISWEVNSNVEANSNYLVALYNSDVLPLSSTIVEDNEYSINDIINGWTVIYIGKDKSFNYILPKNTKITLTFFLYDNFLNYSENGYINIYIDTIPPSQMSGNINRIDQSNITITFNMPIEDDVKYIFIYRSENENFPNLQNGNDINDIDGFVKIFKEENNNINYNYNQFTINDIVPLPITYYYFLFCCDTSFNYSEPIMLIAEEYFIEVIPKVDILTNNNTTYVTYSENGIIKIYTYE